MDYEELLNEITPLEKKIKESLALAQKQQKTVCKDGENGDIRALRKDIQTLSDTLAATVSAIGQLQTAAEDFNIAEYFVSGEFERQMLDLCARENVNVKGESPVYEMFPYRVKIDIENQDIYVDKKKVQCVRPNGFVSTIKAGKAKLDKASFNPEAFASELADAYDLTLLKSGKKAASDLYLLDLYKTMTPMSRSRKEYDLQSFAYDIARLYSSGVTETKTGRQFQMGPGRNNSKAVRILDINGKESYQSVIRFY